MQQSQWKEPKICQHTFITYLVFFKLYAYLMSFSSTTIQFCPVLFLSTSYTTAAVALIYFAFCPYNHSSNAVVSNECSQEMWDLLHADIYIYRWSSTLRLIDHHICYSSARRSIKMCSSSLPDRHNSFKLYTSKLTSVEVLKCVLKWKGSIN